MFDKTRNIRDKSLGILTNFISNPFCACPPRTILRASIAMENRKFVRIEYVLTGSLFAFESALLFFGMVTYVFLLFKHSESIGSVESFSKQNSTNTK